ncbi:ankyrin repeat domain-containing protein [Inhella proteolytica]|uniref:Ankyrin repeat domain-containing protein n=1 Tax=Inhella proteolytica TaxID=2795029 RepID=A0A931J5S9_9BURK|nr:ankyrin repeat domain-containing protein [Inhella proteolytica]MBH9576847.1 ankyrin repeat domain-containing protein [Inhella proteolytica]
MRDKDGLLLAAVKVGDFEAAQAAIAGGASKDAATPFGFTALHIAATAGHLPIVRLLVDNGADIDCRDSHGLSPLHQAIGWPEVMQALLDSGADVDGVTAQGVTPLMCASAFGELASARLLLVMGAKVDLRDDRDSTAADIAREKGADEIAVLLDSITSQSTDSESPV